MTHFYYADPPEEGIPAPTTRVYRVASARSAPELTIRVTIAREHPDGEWLRGGKRRAPWAILADLTNMGWGARISAIAKRRGCDVETMLGHSRLEHARGRHELWSELANAGFTHTKVGQIFGRGQTTISYGIDTWLNRQPRRAA